MLVRMRVAVRVCGSLRVSIMSFSRWGGVEGIVSGAISLSWPDLLRGEVRVLGCAVLGVSSWADDGGEGELERVCSECQNHGIDATPCYADGMDSH